MIVPQNRKNRITILPTNSTPMYYIPKKNEKYVHTKTYTQTFISALFIITKKAEKLKCPPSNEMYFYIHILKIWNPFLKWVWFSKKIWNADRWYNMEETWKCYTKLLRPVTKITYCMMPFIWNIQNRQIDIESSCLGLG